MHPTRQFETAVCGGSNLKAPMKLDFLRSLCAQERHAWPEVVLCRVEGETLPVCCLSEAAAGDPFARIGIVTAPSEALTALLRTAPVRARVTALCDSAGEPCDGGAPDVWGFLAEYRCGDPLSGAVRAAIDGAGYWRRMLHVTLPAITPTIVLMAALQIGNVLNAGFDQVYNLLNSAVMETGDILDTLVYRYGMKQANYSMSTACSLFKSAVSAVLMIISYRAAYKFSGYRLF